MQIQSLDIKLGTEAQGIPRDSHGIPMRFLKSHLINLISKYPSMVLFNGWTICTAILDYFAGCQVNDDDRLAFILFSRLVCYDNQTYNERKQQAVDRYIRTRRFTDGKTNMDNLKLHWKILRTYEH